jgi:hypothetical protein
VLGLGGGGYTIVGESNHAEGCDALGVQPPVSGEQS